MSKAKKARTRKTRRQHNAALKHGPSAKPTHKGKSGRTGGMFTRALRSRGKHDD